MNTFRAFNIESQRMAPIMFNEILDPYFNDIYNVFFNSFDNLGDIYLIYMEEYTRFHNFK